MLMSCHSVEGAIHPSDVGAAPPHQTAMGPYLVPAHDAPAARLKIRGRGLHHISTQLTCGEGVCAGPGLNPEVI